MNAIELMKLFDFILENAEIQIAEGEAFTRDDLVKIRKIVGGKLPNDFQLNARQRHLLIEIFQKKRLYFNQDTPLVLLEDIDCIKTAIKRNVTSVNYIPKIPDYLEQEIFQEAKKQGYILDRGGPMCLRGNFEIVLASIKKEPQSADFIKWEVFSACEKEQFIDVLINSNYVLSCESPNYLCSNQKIILHSLQKDKRTLYFMSTDAEDDPEIFKYLLLHEFTDFTFPIHEKQLILFQDKDVMETYLKLEAESFQNDWKSKKARKRYIRLYTDALNTPPKLTSFMEIYDVIIEKSWKEHQRAEPDKCKNIYGKLTAALKGSQTYKLALDDLKCLHSMKDTFTKIEYKLLEKTMEEYFQIYHENDQKDQKKLSILSNTLSTLSARYIAKYKENFKKNRKMEYIQELRKYFMLNLNHPEIKKKVEWEYKKQLFLKLYKENNPEIKEFINKQIETYQSIISRKNLWILVNKFIQNPRTKLDDVIPIPDFYEAYQTEKRLSKLTNRLNQRYISYDSQELTNYRSMIHYDQKGKEFVYQRINFNENDIRSYHEYEEKIKAWNQLKRKISEQIQKMDFNKEKDNSHIIQKLAKELPFQDEYFIFDLEKGLTSFNIKQYFVSCMGEGKNIKASTFSNDDIFLELYHIFVTTGVLWLALLTEYGFRDDLILELKKETGSSNIRRIMNIIGKIVKISKDLNLNLTSYREFFLLKEIATYTNSKDLAILGETTIRRLCEDRSYTFDSEEEIISAATELVAAMATRSKSTVPYIEGKTQNYQYSLYDSQDESILLSGIDTYSCFKVKGDDNDFLHYCALDKNGFVIKITNHQGAFIGKASGFRHGNCVFINQFRTIYDEKSDKDLVKEEIRDINEIFEIACQDFIQTSLKNEKETDKIEYVFATQNDSLVCCLEKLPLSKNLFWEFEPPMDNASEDWKKFVQNTPNLTDDCTENNYFITDFGDSDILCMASIKPEEEITDDDCRLKDVEALYERKRNQVILTKHPTEEMIQKMNKTKAIQIHQSGMKSFEAVELSKDDTVCLGDNWYLIYKADGSYDFCILTQDKKAKIEFLATKYMLEENVLKEYWNHYQSIEVGEMANIIREELLSQDSKVLKISF